MSRTYILKKRAEQQAETRKRILEAAVDLHTNVGPAATTFSMVAKKAGVQRHTLYAHFPDERSLLMACSGHVQEQAPPPDATAWRAIEDGRERLTAGLAAIYRWYQDHAQLLSCVLRDAEHHPLVREISRLRYGPVIAQWREVLGAKLNTRQRAVLDLALSFHTWRTLVREAGLKPAAAIDVM